MAGDFDAVRSISEEIAGLSDVRNALGVQRRAADEQMAQAEMTLAALTKLLGFVDIELERKRGIREELLNKKEEGK